MILSYLSARRKTFFFPLLICQVPVSLVKNQWGSHNFVRNRSINFLKMIDIHPRFFCQLGNSFNFSACSGAQWTEEIAQTTPTNHVIKMSKNSGRNLLPELPCNKLKQNLNYEIYFHQPKFQILKWIIQSPLKFKKNDFVQFLSHFCKKVLFVNSLDKV